MHNLVHSEIAIASSSLDHVDILNITYQVFIAASRAGQIKAQISKYTQTSAHMCTYTYVCTTYMYLCCRNGNLAAITDPEYLAPACEFTACGVFFSHASQHWYICITWSCSHMCVHTKLATLVQILAPTTFSGHGHSEINATPLPSSLCENWVLKTWPRMALNLLFRTQRIQGDCKTAVQFKSDMSYHL